MSTASTTATIRPSRAPRRSRAAMLLPLAAVAAVSGSVSALTLVWLTGSMTMPSRLEAAWTGAPVDAGTATRLVRRALLSLDDANRTANYAVFRGTTAEAFRARHSPDDLARIFASIARLDLGVAALASPDWSTPPVLDPRGLLKLTGTLPGNGHRLAFDLTFHGAGDDWRLYAVSVRAIAAEPQA